MNRKNIVELTDDIKNTLNNNILHLSFELENGILTIIYMKDNMLERLKIPHYDICKIFPKPHTVEEITKDTVKIYFPSFLHNEIEIPPSTITVSKAGFNLTPEGKVIIFAPSYFKSTGITFEDDITKRYADKVIYNDIFQETLKMYKNRHYAKNYSHNNFKHLWNLFNKNIETALYSQREEDTKNILHEYVKSTFRKTIDGYNKERFDEICVHFEVASEEDNPERELLIKHNKQVVIDYATEYLLKDVVFLWYNIPKEALIHDKIYITLTDELLITFKIRKSIKNNKGI